MSNQIVLATTSYVNQNVDLVNAAVPTVTYDYEFDIDLTNVGTLNALFTTRHFQQNAAANDYDVSLTMNAAALNTWLNSDSRVQLVGNSGVSTTGVVAEDSMAGLRFLEVLAIKIFGHAKARAAILNDTSFYEQDLYNALSNSMNAALVADRNLIFAQYVNLDRVEENAQNDVDVNADFNFHDLSLVFPVRLVGQIDDGLSAVLNNGPASVGGSSLLVNGRYNVPLKFTFSS